MQGYFRTKFIPTEVGVMKFRTTHMRSKDSENIGTSGSRMSLEAAILAAASGNAHPDRARRKTWQVKFIAAS